MKEIPLDTPAEAYYGMQMASLAARPLDSLVDAKSSSPMLVAHAVKRRDGSVAVVLINKHPNQSFSVEVCCARYTAGRVRNSLRLWPRQFQLQQPWATPGPSQGKIDGAGNSFSLTVLALSECVVIFPGK